MPDIRVPFGLCEIEYGDMKLIQGDDATFEAIPSFEKVKGGVLNQTQGYMPIDYDVSLTIGFDKENYDILKLHYPLLDNYKDGLIDNPTHVNMTGQRLTIRLLGDNTKDHDITIYDAYIEPKGFKRTFKKETDKFEVKFIGKPKKVNGKLSWFYIGDSSWLGDTI